MQLSLHADYALRVLVYLGTHPDRVITTKEISDSYGISKNHLVRVIHTLAKSELVRIQPGRTGGIRLARDPGAIRLGDVVRQAEPNMRLVECFTPSTNTCPIAAACALKGMLNDALSAFLEDLNRHTLEDVIRRSGKSRLASSFVTFIANSA
jgi:Rrf2 family transcriptional regulator, nitric oxide-sensitive transcriptional repressor